MKIKWYGLLLIIIVTAFTSSSIAGLVEYRAGYETGMFAGMKQESHFDNQLFCAYLKALNVTAKTVTIVEPDGNETLWIHCPIAQA